MTNRPNRGWRIRGNTARAMIHRSRPTPDQPHQPHQPREHRPQLTEPPSHSQDTPARVKQVLIIQSYWRLTIKNSRVQRVTSPQSKNFTGCPDQDSCELDWP